MNRYLLGLAGAAWFGVVYWGTLIATFPSDDVVRFLAHAVETQTGGRYKLELASVRPWWVGLSASTVVVSSVTRAATATEIPFFLADNVSVRIHPLALLRRGRQFSGSVTMEDGTIDWQLSAVDEDGQFKLRRIFAEIDDLALTDLVGMMSSSSDGAPIEGSGSIDGSIELNIKEGMDKAEGDISFTGDGLRIEKITAPAMGLGNQELDMPITELDIRLSGKDGVLSFDRGVVGSQLANIDVSGEITLADKLDRARARLAVEAELGDWAGTPLEAFRSIVEASQSTAKCDDGRLHYTVNASLGRLGVGDFKPERCKSASAPARPAGRPTLSGDAPAPPTAAAAPPAFDPQPPAEPARPEPRAVPEPEPEPVLDEVAPEEGGENPPPDGEDEVPVEE